VKKTIAALGATVLGLGSVVVAGAVPATAAPVLPDCENMQEQLGAESGSPDPAEMWFENCIPQYGIGKAEFTIVADETDSTVEFPEGFTSLEKYDEGDSPISVSTTTDAAALTEYLDAADAPFDFAPIIPIELIEEDASSQLYVAQVYNRIESISYADAATTPAAITEICEFDDSVVFGGWVAAFDPIDTTFSQTVDGKAWDYTITGQSPDSYFLVTDDGWLCMTDGETQVSGPFETGGFIYAGLVLPFIPESISGPTSFEQLGGGSASLEQLLGDVQSAAIGDTGLYTLGVFGPDGAAPAPAPAPALAATGSDGNSLVLPAIIVGGIVILGGALVAVSVVRKRRKDEPATPLNTPDTTV
jgi:hypothetical protein